MAVHQCPKCELRFTWKTEVEAHCRDEHPEFTHEYHTHSWEVAHPKPAEPPRR